MPCDDRRANAGAQDRPTAMPGSRRSDVAVSSRPTARPARGSACDGDDADAQGGNRLADPFVSYFPECAIRRVSGHQDRPFRNRRQIGLHIENPLPIWAPTGVTVFDGPRIAVLGQRNRPAAGNVEHDQACTALFQKPLAIRRKGIRVKPESGTLIQGAQRT